MHSTMSYYKWFENQPVFFKKSKPYTDIDLFCPGLSTAMFFKRWIREPQGIGKKVSSENDPACKLCISSGNPQAVVVFKSCSNRGDAGVACQSG